MRHSCVRTTLAAALASFVLGCGSDFELASIGVPLEPMDDDAPYRFDPRDYVAKDAPQPSRAAAWSWPEPEAFRATFETGSENRRVLGVAVGRRLYVDQDGAEISDLHRRVLGILTPGDGSPALIVGDPLRRGCSLSLERFEESSDGAPFRPGRIRIDPDNQTALYFDVEYGSPPTRLHAEDFRDWVYARTLVESGRDLAAANAESARELATDDDATDANHETATERRGAELAVDCYESGLVACYLAARFRLPSRGSAPPLPRLALDAEALARGPVDLTRFFVGYLLDELQSGTRIIRRFGWRQSMPRRVALAAFESGQAAALRDELLRRARDPARDTWTRLRMLSTLTALVDAERGAADESRKGQGNTIQEASTECALAVLAEPTWTEDDAYERCVGRPRRISEQLAAGSLLELEARRLRRELHVEPPAEPLPVLQPPSKVMR